jgi:ankyrin repeat protein
MTLLVVVFARGTARHTMQSGGDDVIGTDATLPGGSAASAASASASGRRGSTRRLSVQEMRDEALDAGTVESMERLLRRPSALSRCFGAGSGYDVNDRSDRGKTMLWMAAYSGLTGCVRFLLAADNPQAARLDANLGDDAGRSPLFAATFRNRVDVVRLLLAHRGVDPNRPDAFGITPLMCACGTGHIATVEALLASPRVDVNAHASDKVGRLTALLAAARRGSREIIAALLAHRPPVDVNAADADGSTAVSQAAANGHTEVLDMLLKVPGIQVNTPTRGGLTALGLARLKGHKDAEALLGA